MSKITALLDNLDISALVPNLEALLSKVPAIAVLAVMIGPVLLLALGLLYLFAPPKEANHKAGFRTYFGMGSVQAWLLTQRIAGIVLGGLGAILTVIMGIICLGFGGLDTMLLVKRALTCLIWVAALVAVAYLAVIILVTVSYDENGFRRR